jgi:hypothetical protein
MPDRSVVICCYVGTNRNMNRVIRRATRIVSCFVCLCLMFSASQVRGQEQVLATGPMENWTWINDTSWQRFRFTEAFVLTDVGYDNRDVNPFMLSVYKNGVKSQDVSFVSNGTGVWAFSTLGTALQIESGDIIDIVGSGANEYVGVSPDISSQVSGVVSDGFWFNAAHYYQSSGVGTLQPYTFANIKVQRNPSNGVPEPSAVVSMLTFLAVVGGFGMLRRWMRITQRV